MIDAKKVQEALRDGYAYPCAMCVKLHWGLDRKYGHCKATHENVTCGGPLAGMAFPAYEGALSPEHIAKHCFRCGKPASKILEGNRDPGRFVGVCKRHLPVLDRVIEVNPDPT